jgi:PAS domain-containing protein
MWSQYLNPAGTQFVPWPSEETIRRGALASIQILVDQGVDLSTFDPEKSAELEAERKRVEEEQERLREQERARLEEERRREMERRMSVSGAVPERREEQPFQLETFDDDEDDY